MRIGEFCVSKPSNFQPVYSLYHIILKKCGVISKCMQIEILSFVSMMVVNTYLYM